MRLPVNDRVTIVGGGVAGLAAAIYLARQGRIVTLFERRPNLGGRAVTSLRFGYRFNLGPHAVYRNGASSLIYRELGIPIRGGVAPRSGVALLEGQRYRLPGSPMAALASNLLPMAGKMEAMSFAFRNRIGDPAKFAGITFREWLDDFVSDPALRRLIEALGR